MRLSDFTTVELQRVARALLRSYLDVRTGAAPAAALARFLSPVAAIGLQRLVTDHRGSRSVRHGDLGQVTVLRLSPDRAYAIAALARPGEGAREVLSVELKVQGERVAAVRVGEAESRARERQDLREIQLVGPGQPVPEPPAHLVGLLGGVPSDPHALERWASAAAVIDTYRERYGIDDAGSAFGSIPNDPEQRQERGRALGYVGRLAREVEAIEPKHERAVDQDRQEGPELGL
jgi:hypothetical protein